MEQLASLIGIFTPIFIPIITLIIVYWVKPVYADRKIHVRELETEIEYEQKKKIKDAVAKYKINMIRAADLLRGRLNNMKENEAKENEAEVELNFKGKKYEDLDSSNHYFHSCVYRMLQFFAWIKVVENSLIHLDTTIATDEDLYYVKYLEVFKRILQTKKLDEGMPDSKQGDTIRRDILDEVSSFLIRKPEKPKDVLSFKEYKKNKKEHFDEVKRVFEYFDGVCFDEDRIRWDKLQVLHLTIICFLNSYGYEFYHRDDETIKKVVSNVKNQIIFENLKEQFEFHKLAKEKSINQLIGILFPHLKSKPQKWWKLKRVS